METLTVVRQSVIRSFSRIIFSLVFIGLCSAAIAQDIVPAEKSGVHYLGEYNNLLVFQVDFPVSPNEVLYLEIKDKDGYVFYNTKFKDTHVKKQFAIAKSEMDENTLTFVLSTNNTVKNESFNISRVQVLEGIRVVKQGSALAKQ